MEPFKDCRILHGEEYFLNRESLLPGGNEHKLLLAWMGYDKIKGYGVI